MRSLKWLQRLFAASVVLLLLAMDGCVPSVTGVTINEGDQVLVVGGSKQLTVTVLTRGSASTDVEWDSNAPEVASVTNAGLVTALFPGQALITATSVVDETKSDTVTVTVLAGEVDPSISIEKATNGLDADAPPGPLLQAGDPVTWTYVVENTGNVTLTDVVVTDDMIGPIACPQDELAPGESMTCSASGVAVEGQYANLGTVTGTPPIGDDVTDSDPSHYFGEEEEDPPVPGREGSSFGDPHVRTMDGTLYSFQAVGDYVLSRSTVADDDFEVQVRYVPLETFGRQWSANSAVAAMVAGDQVEVHLGASGVEIYVNQILTPSTGNLSLAGGGSIALLGSNVIVSWPDATMLEAHLRPTELGRVSLFLPETRAGLVEGLFGDYDGDGTNDLRIRDGDVVTDTSERNLYDGGFRNSWSIAMGASASLFSQGIDPFDPDYPSDINSLADFEASDVAAALQTCADRGVVDAQILSLCALDILVSGDETWADVAAAVDPSRPSIRILPALAYVRLGGERRFHAVVTGISDAAVSWSLDGAGTLTPHGTDRAIYTAPDSPGAATIRATSVADPSLTTVAAVFVFDHFEVPAGVVATVNSISGQVDNPHGALSVGLYGYYSYWGNRDTPLATGTVSTTGSLSIELPTLDAAQVAALPKFWYGWCGEMIQLVDGTWVVSDDVHDQPAPRPPSRSMYMRMADLDDVGVVFVMYTYSLESIDRTCAIDQTGHDVDVRIRPGWNVVASYWTIQDDGGLAIFWRTGVPPVAVPWQGPFPEF